LEQKIENTPGPGNYDTKVNLTTPKEHAVKISQAKRQDIWGEQANKEGMPGPGSLDPYDPKW